MKKRQGLGTHLLIGAINAVVVSVADPFLTDAPSCGAGKGSWRALVHRAAVPLVASIAAVVVPVAFEAVLDAVAVSAGELVRATSLICTNPEE